MTSVPRGNPPPPREEGAAPAAAWGGKPAAGDDAMPGELPEGPAAPGDDPGPEVDRAAAATAAAAGLVPGALTMSVPVIPRAWWNVQTNG